jgi:hypothetical protein
MKKIYYLFAFVAVIAAFSSCKPLDKTYDTLGDVPGPAAPSLSVTLTATDYKILNKGAAAYTSLYFKSQDTAKVQIPTILASKYPTLAEKSSVAVTYNATPVTIKLADSLNATTAITLQTTPTSDYVFPAYNGAAANTFNDFSATAVINYLKYKYQTPLPDNSLRVLTYLFFESGGTASAGNLVTDAFLYTGAANGWQKIYRINNAQYTSVNRGTNFWFLASDAASLPSYFNTFLKADATVMLTAKAGDVIYVNYRYLTTYQRVLPLTFDGTNWTTTPNPVTLQFIKSKSAWVADNTVTYKLTTADYALIKTMPTTVNIQGALDNVAQFGDFNITIPVSPTTGWTDAQVNAALVLILAHDFPAAVANQKFVITYVAYNGATINVTKTFI